MKKILFAFLGIISPFFIYSQSFPAPLKDNQVFSPMWDDTTIRNRLLNNGSERINNDSSKPYYESINGSPFLNDEYLDVKVNNYETKVTGRYDAYKDNFEIIIAQNKKLFYMNKYVGNTITFLDLGTKFIILNNGKKKGFFRVLKENENLMFAVSNRKKLVGGKKPQNTYDSYVQPFFKDKSTKYYVSFDGENAIEIPKKGKKFAKLFNKNSDKVKQHIKKNKLSLRNENDLKALFNFLNTL